jgi:hypothetical protein
MLQGVERGKDSFGMVTILREGVGSGSEKADGEERGNAM